ncbi:MAG TPA: hypothetical protein DCY07_03125 [Rhodospirillaceae bacterium]|nr:hypothetical protein [Rhodospirillaceae bacterium]
MHLVAIRADRLLGYDLKNNDPWEAEVKRSRHFIFSHDRRELEVIIPEIEECMIDINAVPKIIQHTIFYTNDDPDKKRTCTVWVIPDVPTLGVVHLKAMEGKKMEIVLDTFTRANILLNNSEKLLDSPKEPGPFDSLFRAEPTCNTVLIWHNPKYISCTKPLAADNTRSDPLRCQP